MNKKIKIILISIISILTIAVGVLGYKVYNLEQNITVLNIAMERMSKSQASLIEAEKTHFELTDRIFKQVDFITKYLGGKFE